MKTKIRIKHNTINFGSQITTQQNTNKTEQANGKKKK